MKNKKFLGLCIFLLLGIFLINLISSVEISYCCEKTIDGLWCQNQPREQCDESISVTGEKYKVQPTSCESTAYCKKGCCFDSQEGTCLENTAQKNCEIKGGVWADDAECDIPQCSYGCCLIGNQAAFVTQTRCKRLASIYGLETNFRQDIKNEIQCIASATSYEKGACVFEREFQKTCELLTQKECQEMDSSGVDTEFHKGYLCSAEELGTICGPSEQTTCVEGRDEIFYLDTCGNLANVYDATKMNDKTYWSKIVEEESLCKLNLDTNSKYCGNCDYFLGSTCKAAEKQDNPVYGDNICKDLSCEYDTNRNGKIDSDEHYSHGETWCATNAEKGNENDPGARYFRLVCYNGEVTVEPCEDFRNQFCIESEVNGFKTAACKTNRYHDCIEQTKEEDCLNTAKRDCEWISLKNNKQEVVEEFCVPKYSPGFDFWEIIENNQETTSLCSSASIVCVAEFEKGYLDDKWQCVHGCHCCFDEDSKYHEGCTGDQYWLDREQMCQALGDCGSSLNYLGIKGYPKNSTERESSQ